jgi:glycosyltransferase involved in cell wall biosynthesis
MNSNKLSVVQIIDRLNIGGAERVLVTLSNILHSHGHTVKVITIVTPGPLANQLQTGIEVVNLNRRWKWNPFRMQQLVNQIKRFDVIHVHSSHNLRYLYASLKLFRLNKAVFFHEHFGDIEISKKVHWHQRLIYPSTILIVVSRIIENWALNNLKMRRNTVFLLPNIVPRFEKEEMNENGDADIFKIVMVANIRSTKNVEFGIDLLQQLTARSNNFQLTIVGQKPSVEYFHFIERKITERKLSDKISFLENCYKIQPLLFKFHLGLHTALSESGPLVLIEYLAQGLPFVTYNTGEVVHQIRDELPELIAYSFNTDEWIEKINFLLIEKNRELIRNKMQQVFEKYYSPEKYYSSCLEIYNAGLGLSKNNNS